MSSVYTLGFSSSRNIQGIKDEYLLRDLLSLSVVGDFDRFVTGGCRGGDTLIGRLLVELYPKAAHVVVVPGNLSQVDFWWTKANKYSVIVETVWMPESSTYKDRNQEIVNQSSMLMAFPEFPERDPRSKRSGTWQTIRLAAGKIPVETHTMRSDEDLV